MAEELVGIEEIQGDSFDWGSVFAYAANPRRRIWVPTDERTALSEIAQPGFSQADVARVIAAVNGENDEASWVGAFELKDGRFAVVRAWCDFTGWG
jgi:hypothetical protein